MGYICWTDYIRACKLRQLTRSLSRDADLQPYVTQIARLLYIDKEERDTLDSERFVQYLAAAMLDELISLNVSSPPEVVVGTV
ncbi:hypothetical protein [Lysinibacillus xylanilyticus]|uniref:hypothetical protein n=1 Tax=Lysinibacillus xylanilyticus TaxID=582475 RepID=UPI0037F59857